MEPKNPDPSGKRFGMAVEMAGVLLAATVLGLLFNAISPLGTDFRAQPAALVPNLAGRSQQQRGYVNQTLALSFEAFVSAAGLVETEMEAARSGPQKPYLNETRSVSFGPVGSAPFAKPVPGATITNK